MKAQAKLSTNTICSKLNQDLVNSPIKPIETKHSKKEDNAMTTCRIFNRLLFTILFFVTFMTNPKLAQGSSTAHIDKDDHYQLTPMCHGGPVNYYYGDNDEYVWFEAECYDVYGPGEIGSDRDASEYLYVHTPKGSGRYTDKHDPRIEFATYHFNLQYGDDMFVHMRVKTPSSKHNSLWLEVDNHGDIKWMLDDDDFFL